MDETPADPAEFQVTLDEFCTHLSAKDKRVELIAAFAHVERAVGRLVDVPSAFTERFDAFGVRPVMSDAHVIVRRRR